MNKKIVPLVYDDADAQALIARLDAYQVSLYGLENCNLDSVEVLKNSGAYMLGAYCDGKLAGMGAVKLFDGYAEIKRMFVDDAYRGLGIARDVLSALETYAIDMGRRTVYLETGFLHHAALALYKASGYVVVDSFGSYKPNKVSIYFTKRL